MTGTCDKPFTSEWFDHNCIEIIASDHPLYTVKSISKTGHKEIFHIAVHENQHKTFKTERGARNWLARWEEKKP